MKTLNIAFLVVYLLSALVQFNDPDPLRWILIYATMSLLCFLQHIDRLHWIAPALLTSVSLVWISTLVPVLTEGIPWSEILGSLTMQNDTVEEVREIGGLLLILLWAIVLLRLNLAGSKVHIESEP